MNKSLSVGQTAELHKSLIAYLTTNNLPQAALALRNELNLPESVFDAATLARYDKLLEKKWTMIGRLQKKITELEARNVDLQAELDSASTTSSARRVQDPLAWLPKLPPRHALESHQDTVNCIAFHPTFSTLASGSDDCFVKIWDWDLGDVERTLRGHTRAVSGVDFGGPRGAVLLASCSSDLTIKLWDPANEYRNVRTLVGHDHSVSAVRFIPSAGTAANLLVSASRDKTLRVWDAVTGYCIQTIVDAHAAWVRDVTPSIDGRYLVSVGDDMSARLWDMSPATPEPKITAVGHEHFIQTVAIAPASAHAALAHLAGLSKPPPPSESASFFATGARDKTVRLWDATTGTCIAVLRGHDNWVRGLAFHPGGKFLLSVADDKSIRCWDLAQEARCVKILHESAERFVTCIRWAPHKSGPPAADTNGATATATASESANGVAGTASTKALEKAALATLAASLRCVIATGSVDCRVRVFAN